VTITKVYTPHAPDSFPQSDVIIFCRFWIAPDSCLTDVTAGNDPCAMYNIARHKRNGLMSRKIYAGTFRDNLPINCIAIACTIQYPQHVHHKDHYPSCDTSLKQLSGADPNRPKDYYIRFAGKESGA